MDATRSFGHQALLYASTDEFLSATVPFIQSGLAKSEPVFVVTDPRKLTLLRDTLEDAASRVSFEDNASWYDLPARALSAAHRAYWERQRIEGGPIRVIGEPVWSGRSDVQIREWKRFESLVNVTYAGFPILALCPYDAHALPASVLADAYRTHPALSNGSKSQPNPKFVDPRTFVYELDQREELPEPEGPTGQLVFDGDLGGLRRFVVNQARRAGVTRNRVEELEWVANEIATNVLRHGGGMALVRTWNSSEEFICEIEDRGQGINDPLVGHLPPCPDEEAPSGLWLAHQLCDLVQIRSSTSGLKARLHVARDATG